MLPQMRLRADGLTWREIEGETVLLDLRSSTYFRTNRTGTRLLRVLADGCEREALVATLTGDFGLSAEQAGADADAFVAQLEQRGLLDDAS